MSARAQRRAYAIHAYVGGNGGGKSLAAVYDTLPTLDGIDWRCRQEHHAHLSERGEVAGQRLVYSTTALFEVVAGKERPDGGGWAPVPRRTGFWRRPHPLYRPLTALSLLLDLEHADVILDEVTGVASSRTSMSLPPEIANLLVQLRRRDVVVRWTTPDYRRADTIIREVTQAVTYCSGFFKETMRDDELALMWRCARLFFWRTYDAFAFEEFTSSKREDMRTLAKQLHLRKRHAVQDAYDTFGEVLSLMDHVTESGTCMNCGGHRARPKCRCESATGQLHGIGGVVADAGTVLVQGGRPRARDAGASRADLVRGGLT